MFCCLCCLSITHPIPCSLRHTFSTLPHFLWSCLILFCRQKTLTWPCWPAFLWLCLTLLYAGGYPFVHYTRFLCGPALPLTSFTRAKLDSEKGHPHLILKISNLILVVITSDVPIIYLDCNKHFCQPGTDHQNSEVKKKPCQVIPLQTLY